MKTGECYWRFKGEKAYRYGWVTEAGRGLYRMGVWNGDVSRGPIVDAYDVEIK